MDILIKDLPKLYREIVGKPISIHGIRYYQKKPYFPTIRRMEGGRYREKCVNRDEVTNIFKAIKLLKRGC